MDNVKKIDQSLIQVEEHKGLLDNGRVLSITFNIKDHPYDPEKLKDQTEMSMQDDEDNQVKQFDTEEEEEDKKESNDEEFR